MENQDQGFEPSQEIQEFKRTFEATGVLETSAISSLFTYIEALEYTIDFSESLLGEGTVAPAVTPESPSAFVVESPRGEAPRSLPPL